MSSAETGPVLARDDAVTLPRRPGPPARAHFPWLAAAAPLVGAAVLVAVTRSPMMIAFAVLSPVIVIAGVCDARISARRRRRRDDQAYAEARERFLVEIGSAHDRERRRAETAHPTPAAIMTDPDRRPQRWAASAAPAPVRIATGRGRSAVPVSGSADGDEARELVAAARANDDMPLLVDPSGGVGIVGPLPVARALARGIVVQLAHAHAPGVVSIHAPSGPAYTWVEALPHATPTGGESMRLVLSEPDRHDDARTRSSSAVITAAAPPGESPVSVSTVSVSVAERVEDLPAACATVIAADAAGRVVVLSPPDDTESLKGELVTAAEVTSFGAELAETARRRGLGPDKALPQTALWHTLPPATARAGLLPAVFAAVAHGVLELDLVASGPHAIVTGTTGSGKSELLVSWLLGMAATSSPDAVTFLLVDFKGGTAFSRLADLPHTVGVVTDLRHGEAHRALLSLRAELRRREAELAGLGVADVRDTQGRLARLVVVVDEAAAMLSEFPELTPLFTDIAARGRALGIHLIVGTQRSTGVLPDALVANCALRLSLRLASTSDSTALLGSDAAARLPHAVPGRFLVAHDGELTVAQAATATASDVARTARAWSPAVAAVAPWLPPLPRRVELAAFPSPPMGAVVIGLADDPERQRQQGVLHRPARAHLLIVGARGSGRSNALAAIAAQWSGGDVLTVPADVEGAWDALHCASRLHVQVEGAAASQAGASAQGVPFGDASSHSVLVAIDDVDALLDRFGDDHRDTVLEILTSLVVDGARRGVSLTCTARALPSGLRSVASAFGERLILRQADRQEHVLAGAPVDLFDPDAPAGRGVWRGLLLQTVTAPGTSSSPAAARHADDSNPTAVPLLSVRPGEPPCLIVSAAAASAARRLRTAFPDAEVLELEPSAATLQGTNEELAVGSRPRILVGDPDAWQSAWSLLGRLRSRSRLVFDGCTPAQVRGILRSRTAPPPVTADHVLVWHAERGFTRARLPR
jgi:S-DNA-T family DNA segregation ATPase FtsK/SpoIIIE